MSSETNSSSFCLLIFLLFCPFIFLSQLVFNSSSLLILFHISSLEFAWKPSESFLLSFHIIVLLSYCLSVILSLSDRVHLSSCLVHLSSSQFILVLWKSSLFFLSPFASFGLLQYKSSNSPNHSAQGQKLLCDVLMLSAIKLLLQTFVAIILALSTAVDQAIICQQGLLSIGKVGAGLQVYREYCSYSLYCDVVKRDICWFKFCKKKFLYNIRPTNFAVSLL